MDDLIKFTQINLKAYMMELVPYNRFNNVQFIAQGGFSQIYRTTWIDGNIQGWNKVNLNFERRGRCMVALKNLMIPKILL